MTQQEQTKITKLSKEFVEAMGLGINGTGWMVVDPLSGFLSMLGHENKLFQIPETKEHPQVLVMQFKDGSQFIPAGADLKPLNSKFKNWIWI